MSNDDAVILSACRTPVGKLQGGLASLSATKLGGIVIREAVSRAKVSPSEIDECIFGQVLQGGAGQAPATQAALAGGLAPTTSCLTVNKVCGSSLMAVILAAQHIRLGDARIVVAGGMESMTNAPYFLDKARDGYRMGHGEIKDLMIHDGLWCATEDWHMGSAAEYIAEKFKVTRAMQDEFAAQSHAKALSAMEKGKFDREIIPVSIPQRKGDPVVVKSDESPRPGTSVETLAKLATIFKRDGGTVTAGNAPGINDGAAALVVTSRAKAESIGVKPLARITGYATAALAPKELFYTPVVAVKKLNERLGVGIHHWDLIEANEAFSAQALADGNELGWKWDRVNVNGGAVAIGHPIGASGARILTTLLHAMIDRGAKTGMATMCLGGGGAVALGVERE
jgi:acetyl-CoA C-acetyltransferase